MRLISGYSSSDSDAESESSKISKNQIELFNSTASIANKTSSGSYDKKAFDSFKFKRNKRLYKDSIIVPDESKRIKSDQTIKATKSKSKELHKKKPKKPNGNLTSLDGEENAYRGSWASSSDTSEEEDVDYPDSENKTSSEFTHGFKEVSKYYGARGLDIMEPPISYQVKFATTITGQKEYFVPKKLLSKYKAHKSAVTSLQFFPNTGHTLLSSGNDGMIKLWSVAKPKQLLRDYYGHCRPVKHTEFSYDGEDFISCSYDKTVKVWDTESGKVVSKTEVQTNPNMCCFVPDHPNEFMVALDGKKVEHYDMRTGELVQTYEHHESSVTWIEFINGGKQFITASDDRSLKVWDLQVNMPIKYIQDPKQQAIPIVKKHPHANWFVGQSMDNQIVVYSTQSEQKFKKNKLKSFRGHNSAAYAIQLGFTPDGRTLYSGDSNGYCHFWDWKSTKVVSTIKVSNDVISCVDVHPLENGLYAMAGYDSNIYLYS